MRVLLGVDDDPVLEPVLDALKHYVKLSEWDDVLLVHVVSGNPLFLVGGDAPTAETARDFLSRVARRLDHLPGALEPVVVRGEPAQEIARLAEEREADLIVIGALGEKRDFLMGSVSQKVVSIADTDVLVVRERAEGEGGIPAEPASEGRAFRALLAVDGSLGSEAGIDAFTRKLLARRALIQLIHVVDAIPPLWQAGRGGFVFSFGEQANEILARARRLLERHGLEAGCEWRQGSPAAQILDVARERRSDLIVVGSRGHAGIRDIVLGSITQRLLRHAPCSVFCARAWAPESAELPASWSSDEWELEAGMA